MREFFAGVKYGMGLFGQNVGLIVNSALLVAVYIAGVGLTSVLGKFFGKQFIEKRVSRNIKSYWSDLNLKKRPMKEYYRQF